MKKIYTGGQADQLGAAATGGLGIVTLSFTYRVCAKLSRAGSGALCTARCVCTSIYIYICMDGQSIQGGICSAQRIVRREAVWHFIR